MEKLSIFLVLSSLFVLHTSGQDCGDNANLGVGFSAAIGVDAYPAACYPKITGFPGGYPNHGYDDAIAVFVGGDFTCINGAEVEGNVVVVGDLTVQSGGPSNFVSVGAGTHVLPNNGGDCVIVGGNLAAYRDIQTFNLQNQMTCDIVYRGTGTNTHRWKTNGNVIRNPDYDMSRYERMKEIFALKSVYWGNLPVNGDATELYTTTTFTCDGTDDVQVFQVNKGDRTITACTSYRFSAECEDKTVLINVMGTGDVSVRAAAMYDFKNSQSDFSTCLAQSILWNFPEADNVDIGAGWTSEFYGSVLVNGNLEFTTTGHSGRTIVVGDLVHDRGGSEFHTYQFKPPVELPCVCVEEYCYEEGRCNPTCNNNVCETEKCVPIEVDCAEILTTNVTLPYTVVYDSCDVNVTLLLREDRNTVLIDHDDYGCEINVEDCDNGIYLGCLGPGSGEAGMFFTQKTEGSVMDLTGSYLVNDCCGPLDPADDRSPPPPRACEYYT